MARTRRRCRVRVATPLLRSSLFPRSGEFISPSHFAANRPPCSSAACCARAKLRARLPLQPSRAPPGERKIKL